MDLDKLDAFFREEEINWKPIAVSKKTGKALAAAYVDNRAVQSRLDEACGKASWRNEFRPGPCGGVLCGLSLLIDGEWITKWDGAENTDIESVKGGLSDSMRRAASQWGIGRYLYYLPNAWHAVDANGRFTSRPKMPAAFLPNSADGSTSGRTTPIEERPLTPRQEEALLAQVAEILNSPEEAARFVGSIATGDEITVAEARLIKAAAYEKAQDTQGATHV